MGDNDDEHRFQLTILGNGAVGKSALVIRMIGKGFVDKYDPTIEDVYTKRLTIDGEEHEFEIVDSAGQEDFATIREQYIQRSHGFLLAYSITDRDSFVDIEQRYLKQIYKVRETSATAAQRFPIVIVGNKCDLGDTDQRVVSPDELKALARAHGCASFETSAKSMVNCNESLLTLASATVHYFGGKANSNNNNNNNNNSSGGNSNTMGNSSSSNSNSNSNSTHSGGSDRRKKQSCDIS